jgi:hypothetical protein
MIRVARAAVKPGLVERLVCATGATRLVPCPARGCEKRGLGDTGDKQSGEAQIDVPTATLVPVGPE